MINPEQDYPEVPKTTAELLMYFDEPVAVFILTAFANEIDAMIARGAVRFQDGAFRFPVTKQDGDTAIVQKHAVNSLVRASMRDFRDEGHPSAKIKEAELIVEDLTGIDIPAVVANLLGQQPK